MDISYDINEIKLFNIEKINLSVSILLSNESEDKPI